MNDIGFLSHLLPFFLNSFFMQKYFLFLISLTLLTSCGMQSAQDLPATPAVSGEVQASTAKQDPYKIGSVDTVFKLIGPDHKIEVGGVPDPKIAGITCFYSRAKTGGVSGGLGLAQDTSDASVACRQTGKISFKEPIKQTEQIWSQDTSLFFKTIQIVRFYDATSNSLIYLVYSDRVIDGSPKNSISAVALEDVKPMLK